MSKMGEHYSELAKRNNWDEADAHYEEVKHKSMSELKFKHIEEVENSVKKIMLNKSESMTEKDVEDFCDWVCAKATRLGFDVKEILKDEDKRVE